ncbi:MAG: DUF2087 domain-containing protein [Defluviitaleaceae bacterium]|nr:DUF2087 domain-containing protein [Defluviitaleaceae bacterium]
MDGAMFWNSSIEDLKRGFKFDEQKGIYICLLCGQSFERGVVYPVADTFYDAEKAIDGHVKAQHPPMFEFYLDMGRAYTGLSAGQEELARLFYQGHSDKEIAAMTGANSVSTIRNQRFAIREKYKQAKILVALTELLEEQMENQKQGRKTASDGDKLIDFHLTANAIDERFAITQAEKKEVLARYFGPDGQVLIKRFPAREKKKIIVMQKIMDDFEAGVDYSEKEVNEIIKRYFDDFESVRRALIQYGFMDRTKDGTRYWVK